MKEYTNNTVLKLSMVIGEVNSAAESLVSAATQVSGTSQLLSQASSEQAASVEQTSGALEQITASIGQNTENAKMTCGQPWTGRAFETAQAQQCGTVTTYMALAPSYVVGGLVGGPYVKCVAN
jgi:methyl-accepting chemotaxis protein